uniref:Uncharacterized protein n=1 Tax=Anguilla anguilla TaxID=7936 RepID=A0A0E9TJJ6_ANGAN
MLSKRPEFSFICFGSVHSTVVKSSVHWEASR